MRMRRRTLGYWVIKLGRRMDLGEEGGLRK
jgi:hypothetical protein